MATIQKISRSLFLELASDLYHSDILDNRIKAFQLELKSYVLDAEDQDEFLQLVDENLLVDEHDGADEDEILEELEEAGWDCLDEVRLGSYTSFINLGLLVSNKECIIEAHGCSSFEEYEAKHLQGRKEGSVSDEGILFEFVFTDLVGEEQEIQIVGISKI